MRSKIVLLIPVIFMFSCTETQEKQPVDMWPVGFENLVELHCKARDLRKQRFDLADSIRNYTDLQLSNQESNEPILADDVKLRNWNIQKDSLVRESKDIADSIKVLLDDVIVKLETDQKRVFNDSLIKAVSSRGCE